MPTALTEGLRSFQLPAAARYVDDQWMSIYCFKHDIPIRQTVLEHYPQIFAVLQNGHEKLGEASLSGMGNRDEKVREVAEHFGVMFVPGCRSMIVDAANEKLNDGP